MKEEMIKNYMASLNINTENVSIKQIKEGLRNILFQDVNVDVRYEKDVMMNEDLKKAEEIDKIKYIDIFYFDESDHIKKLSFMY